MNPDTVNGGAPGRVDSGGYPHEGYAWCVVAILLLVTLFSQLDRQLPALLVQPIRQAFSISDTGFSLLQGYAFALVYTVAGLPFGRLVDRSNRRNLIIFGVAVWSAMTIYSGFAQSYWQLFAGRMGVGVGEAVLAPAAYSMIADYVRPERRGRALGVYYISLSAGSGASLFLGGLILRSIPTAGLHLPIVGHLEPWRLMFVLAGSPGLALACLMLVVREPLRREPGGAGLREGSVREFLGFLKRHGRTFSSILGYPAALALVGYGQLAWAATLYVRRFGMTPDKAGLAVGAIVAGAGLVGTLLAAFLSDHWTARNTPAARLRVAVLGCALQLPGVALWPVAPDAASSLAMFGLNTLGSVMAFAAAPVVVQEVTPNRMRGQAIAVQLLIAGLLGIGFGPTAIALVTDRVFMSDAALPYSIVSVCLPVTILGFWLAWRGLRPYAATNAALAAGAG